MINQAVVPNPFRNLINSKRSRLRTNFRDEKKFAAIGKFTLRVLSVILIQ
jgi:hypothetical protein